jgi:excisionase family DNA binding protein
MTPAMLTPEQVAARVGVCKRTILRAIAAEELPAVKLGHHTIRIDPTDVDAWCEARRIKIA